jgi:hypothetical protein
MTLHLEIFMDTKLAAVFILSGVLGAMIVITGCIKALSKNGELNLKTAGFILAGFIFVALPVLGTVSVEWGEFKLLVNTTNKEMKELQQTLDSLKIANIDLQKDLDSLQSYYNRYKHTASILQAESRQRVELARKIEDQFDGIRMRIGAVNASLDSAAFRSSRIKNDLKKFESERWYKKP